MICKVSDSSSCLDQQNAALQASNIQDLYLLQQVNSHIHGSTYHDYILQHDSAPSLNLDYPKKKTKLSVKFAKASKVFVCSPHRHTSEMSYSDDERKLFLKEALTSALTIDTILHTSQDNMLQQGGTTAEEAIGIEHLLNRGRLLKQMSRQRRDHKALILAEKDRQASLGINDPQRLAVLSSTLSMHNTRQALSRATYVEILNRMD